MPDVVMRLVFAAAIAIGMLVPGAAFAAAQRTFVASYGSDSAPCSLAAPCRGFQAAIDTVAPGGEVVALDSAGYGAMAIHKSVSVIVPPGIHAGLSPNTGIPLPGYPGQSGVVLIDIQNTDVVVLRGLNLNQQGTVTGGIEWISTHGGSVYVEDVVVNGFTKEGLYAEAPQGRLFIKDSVFRNNGVGIYGGRLGGAVSSYDGGIVADRVRIENSTAFGVRVLDGVGATLSNSTISMNAAAFHIDAGSTSARITLDKCTVAYNKELGRLSTPSNGSTRAYFVAGGSMLTGEPLNRTGTGTFTHSLGNNTTGYFTSIFDLRFLPE